MSSDGLIEFEEAKYDELVEEFINLQRNEWEGFVQLKYDDYIAEWEGLRDDR